jgi:hypothetical protein
MAFSSMNRLSGIKGVANKIIGIIRKILDFKQFIGVNRGNFALKSNGWPGA